MTGVTLRYKWITKMYTIIWAGSLVGDKNTQSISIIKKRACLSGTLTYSYPIFFDLDDKGSLHGF